MEQFTDESGVALADEFGVGLGYTLPDPVLPPPAPGPQSGGGGPVGNWQRPTRAIARRSDDDEALILAALLLLRR